MLNNTASTSATWGDWNQQLYVNTANATGPTTWSTWNTTDVSGSFTWRIWNTGTASTHVHVQQAQDMETYRRAQDARLQAQKLADQKAEQLLKENLSDEQRKEYESDSKFLVEAKSGRKYEIVKGTHGNVFLLDENGKRVQKFCVQPAGVPVGDANLAQKLWIEADEDEFVRRANVTRLDPQYVFQPQPQPQQQAA